MNAPVPRNSSVVTIRLGGREYPLITVRSCRVCVSPYRFEIEDSLVSGSKYQSIIDHLPDDAGLNARNVMDHYYNKHLPLEQSRIRAIEEAHAKQMGRDIERGAEDLVDGITLLKVVVQKTFDMIARGEMKPELADGVNAAKALASIGEYDASGADSEAMSEAFMIYMESAQEHMSPEQFEEFGRTLDENPVLKALAARYEDADDGGESPKVPGEVVKAKANA